MAFQLGLLPTAGQKQALAGTVATPATGNEYVTKHEIDGAAASGLNQSGQTLNVIAGLGTGNGLPGSYLVSTGAAAGSSSTLQFPQVRLACFTPKALSLSSGVTQNVVLITNITGSAGVHLVFTVSLFDASSNSDIWADTLNATVILNSAGTATLANITPSGLQAVTNAPGHTLSVGVGVAPTPPNGCYIAVTPIWTGVTPTQVSFHCTAFMNCFGGNNISLA